MGNTGKNHYLKTWPEYFIAVRNGNKTFEIRKKDNDRDFQVGDRLVLQEYLPEKQCYTGTEDIWLKVTYILDKQPFVPDGYVCMGIKRM